MVVRATGHPSLLPLPVSASSQVLHCKQPRPRPRSSQPVHHNREVFMRGEKNEGWKGEIRGERRACLPSLWLSNNLLFRLWWMERQGPGSPLHAWKIGIWRQTEKYLREVLVKQPPTHNFVCSFFLALSSLSLFVSAYSFSIRCQWFRGCEFQHYINKKNFSVVLPYQCICSCTKQHNAQAFRRATRVRECVCVAYHLADLLHWNKAHTLALRRSVSRFAVCKHQCFYSREADSYFKPCHGLP